MVNTKGRKLRVLAVCQNFWPEPFNVDDMCSALVEAGHEVTVLTGVPNYPSGIVPKEYRNKQNRLQEHRELRIVRVPTVARGKDLKGINLLKRVLNYVSFAASGCVRAGRLGRFDVVVAFEFSPIFMVYPAIKVARRQGIPLVVYAIDLWPEDLLTGGVSREGAMFRTMRRLSARVYSRADALAVTSPGFKDYIASMVSSRVPFYGLPQYAEQEFEAMGEPVPEVKSEFRLVFAGNIGGNQALEDVIRAVAAMPAESRLVLHVYGSGSREAACKELASSLGAAGRVTFHGRLPLEEMPRVYASAHAMLLSLAMLENGSLVPILTIPRKLQSYMAAGRPIVSFAEGVASDIVDEAHCGVSIRGGDISALADALSNFERAELSELRAYAGNAKAYYEAHYSRNRFVQDFNSIIERTVNVG